MTLKEWVHEQLDKTFSEGFDWDYVVEDDGTIEDLEGEPKGNDAYLVAKQDDNDVYLFNFDNILKAKDVIKEEIGSGDCMANGGRGGPDLVSEWVILDLVERKVINVNRPELVEFTKEE